jgi:GNAT superfamily N-acetyltransferase
VATSKTAELTVTWQASCGGATAESAVLGLAGVGCHPRHRGRGFGRAAVEAAMARARQERKLLLFQTGDALGLYERCEPGVPIHQSCGRLG